MSGPHRTAKHFDDTGGHLNTRRQFTATLVCEGVLTYCFAYMGGVEDPGLKLTDPKIS